MSKVRQIMAVAAVSFTFSLLTIGALQPASAKSGAASPNHPQATISWDDWDIIPGRVLITYRSSRSNDIKQRANSSGVSGLTLMPIEAPIVNQYVQQHRSSADFISILPDTFVGEFDPKARTTIVQALTADPDVLYFEPDRVRVAAFTWGTSTPNDPLLPLWGMTRIGAPAAWARQSATRASVRVAVMEGGRFDNTHRDLMNQNSAAISNSLPITSHTTHVAGIIAATGNNGLDVAGVANVELVALGDATSGSAFVQAVSWAVNNQVRVINMSFKWCGSGGCGTGVCSYPAPIAAEQTAINNAQNNIVFVAAAANDHCWADGSGNLPLPAAYSGVTAVSAISTSDTIASFSNWGPYVDLTAPGVGIRSTDLGNSTSFMDGTSTAAPHVSGSAAAVLALQPNYDIRSIPLLLALTAEDMDVLGRDNNTGDGLVRVDRATAAIADVYANSSQCGTLGVLRDPLCNFQTALNNTPAGGTLGIVRGSNFPSAQTLAMQVTLVAVGGTVTLGSP